MMDRINNRGYPVGIETKIWATVVHSPTIPLYTKKVKERFAWNRK